MNDLAQITGQPEYIKHKKWKCFCLVQQAAFTNSRTFSILVFEGYVYTSFQKLKIG